MDGAAQMAAPQSDPRFPETHWSIVLAAQGGSAVARRALGKLCAAYWYPLYAYARRRGLAPEHAADVTQDFFLRLIERNSLGNADPARGRFRTFLAIRPWITLPLLASNSRRRSREFNP